MKEEIKKLVESGATVSDLLGESVRRGSYPCFSVDLKTYKIDIWSVEDDMAADAVSYPIFDRSEVSYCYETGYTERTIKAVAQKVAKMLKAGKSKEEVEDYIISEG